MKKFTFLTTALALFAFLAIPLGMRGQTTATFEPADFSEIIVNTGDIEYIKKCFFDEELNERLEFILDDKAILAIGTKDPTIIMKFFEDKIQMYLISKEILIKQYFNFNI